MRIEQTGESGIPETLEEIERLDEPAEFIFAVKKLSEGWDVDNVFQIVPMQERVFESKLLISQVLGRGLRIPRKASHGDILGNYPMVTVTNHEKFADHIRELVDSVTQCEVYLTSAPLPIDGGFVRAGHHFSLIDMAYTPVTSLEDRTGNGGKISPELTLNFQKEKLGYTVTYQETGDKKFQLRKNFFTVDEVAYNQFKRFNLRVFEKRHFQFGETLIDDRIPQAEEIRQIIANALEKAGIAGERLSEENARLVDLYFSQYLPVGKKRPRKESRPGNLILQKTSRMDRSSTRASELDRDAVVFISEDYEEELGKENLFVLEYIKAMRGRMDEKQLSLFDTQYPFIGKKSDLIRCFVGYRSPFVVNTSVFKTPQNLVQALLPRRNPLRLRPASKTPATSTPGSSRGTWAFTRSNTSISGRGRTEPVGASTRISSSASTWIATSVFCERTGSIVPVYAISRTMASKASSVLWKSSPTMTTTKPRRPRNGTLRSISKPSMKGFKRENPYRR